MTFLPSRSRVTSADAPARTLSETRPSSRKAVIGTVVLAAQLPVAAMVAYLDFLSIAAVLWRRPPRETSIRRRFAILVPAHDEEVLLPVLLRSLTALDYPRERYDIHVVADNCTDHTASIAASAGATVHERHDEVSRGKGHALRWLLNRLHVRDDEAAYDAYVVIDADSIVSPTFLTVLNQHLVRGDVAVQAYYGVLNRDESWPATLRYVALALYNDLRPRGRDALGLSAGLRGNGMCFTSALIERFGWEALTLAEDAEFHLQLVEAGLKVSFAPDAVVLAEMPTSLRQARSQNMRWERGRLHILRSFGPRLLMQGLIARDPVRLEAVGEQLVPPLSLLTGLAVLNVAIGAALPGKAARRLSWVVVVGQVAYVATGLRLVKANRKAYAALLAAPFYVVWKIALYATAAVGLNDGAWVRTARSTTPDEATEWPVEAQTGDAIPPTGGPTELLAAATIS